MGPPPPATTEKLTTHSGIASFRTPKNKKSSFFYDFIHQLLCLKRFKTPITTMFQKPIPTSFPPSVPKETFFQRTIPTSYPPFVPKETSFQKPISTAFLPFIPWSDSFHGCSESTPIGQNRKVVFPKKAPNGKNLSFCFAFTQRVIVPLSGAGFWRCLSANRMPIRHLQVVTHGRALACGY